MSDEMHAGRSTRIAYPTSGPAAEPRGRGLSDEPRGRGLSTEPHRRGLSPEQLQAAMKVYAANAAASMRAGAQRQQSAAGPG